MKENNKKIIKTLNYLFVYLDMLHSIWKTVVDKSGNTLLNADNIVPIKTLQYNTNLSSNKISSNSLANSLSIPSKF